MPGRNSLKGGVCGGVSIAFQCVYTVRFLFESHGARIYCFPLASEYSEDITAHPMTVSPEEEILGRHAACRVLASKEVF